MRLYIFKTCSADHRRKPWFVAINNAVRENIDELLEDFQIIHICGKNHLESMLAGKSGYRQFEYVKKELKHLFACADVIISRAGANAICELLALRKPNILIPLGLNASPGRPDLKRPVIPAARLQLCTERGGCHL